MDEPKEKPVRITLTKSQLSTFRGRELFNILSEISADGILSDTEMAQLKAWVNADAKDKLPAESHLSQLIQMMLANGQLSSGERLQLQKEIERILPPSQREEAKAARKRMEVVLDVPSKSPGGSESQDTANKTLSRLEAKQMAQHEALVAAAKANEARGIAEGKRHYDVKIPTRRPYEPNATMKQKDLLWAMGLTDRALLEALGKWQASSLIDQIKAQSGQSGGQSENLAVAGLIVIILALVLYFASQR